MDFRYLRPDNIDLDRLLDQFRYHPKSPLIFNTGFFLLLFLAFLAGYQLLRNRHRARLLYVTAFSLFFYYKSSGLYFLLLVFSTIVEYNFARWIADSDSPGRRKLLLTLSLLVNLGMLFYFKYTNFFLSGYQALTGQPVPVLHVLLPVGISFYTFQTLSYTIDVYRGQIKALRNIWDFAFFVTFFPQLVAGPIVRASDFIPQIAKPPFISREDMGRAVLLIAAGLFKKAVISDYISLNYVERIFGNPTLFSGIENLLGVYGYALQIYCDFSGYSDIAIGIALLLGYRLPPNFLSPYQSTSITEFWRRWHISLSSWLRDYLYIPLGGNRKGVVRQYINLFLTMLLGGLWHGASLTFVAWGALHGAALAVDKLFQKVVRPGNGWLIKLLGWFITFHFVCFCWIFFRAGTFEVALQVIHQITHSLRPDLLGQVLAAFRPVFALVALGYLLHFIPDGLTLRLETALARRSVVEQAVLLTLVIWLVIQVKSAEIQPFIYFQF
ncbi:MBOAT family O-acyltransferase [Hymenobacter convexus]|uniref:MBOAT family O-acyltransferase n=1 Tax=Hymenobacter sp. CA1UV-4 TaxID=3063782 RepID=UPI00271247B6|nr:MBOAT family protein [Hymenobacter sp. CA1UV-4]MDO7851342.1 MBOAT family protein [Hymenobacter sp. CA1UV-4]